MASPLLPTTRLTTCAACSEHIKTPEEVCPHCGALLGGPRGLLARAAGLALAGVMLTSCGGSKDGDDTGNTAAETIYGVSSDASTGTTDAGSSTTDGMTGDTPTGGASTAATTGPDPTSTTTSDTTTDTSTTDTGTDTDTTASEPEYGVPETGTT
jgi:hypothetical protein